ncbi:MAG: hypothetical protein IJ736_03275 [Firmicutes bacterium]|nr:hypothetical protein [Bacillota bacterium]
MGGVIFMGKRAAIYCRLSVEDSEKKGEESESIINQRLLLKEYAKREGFTIVAAYSDECDILY